MKVEFYLGEEVVKLSESNEKKNREYYQFDWELIKELNAQDDFLKFIASECIIEGNYKNIDSVKHLLKRL